MTSGFRTPITIKDAIDKIDTQQFVLPGIQRRFVWHPYQIELLFDSILRDYPMNSLMLWAITDKEIKNNYNYYSFLRTYKQRFAIENELIPKDASNLDFFAVIDGQQRLNSIYLGLKGSYSIKKPHKQWINKTDYFDEKFLYLDISKPFQSENEIDRAYNFRFLTKLDAEKTDGKCWFKVGDILKFDPDDASDEIFIFVNNQEQIIDKKFARTTLNKLYRTLIEKQIINYYLEEEQDLDKILDIFIRTNDGGTKLTFSDLLMSVLTTHWKESRDEFDALINDIRNFGDFNINSDIIIKTLLMLFSDDIKNRVKNFDQELLKKVVDNWDRIKITISNTFQMIYQMGFNHQTFPALNAAVPLIYFVYVNNLENEVIKASFVKSNNYHLIKKWLIMAFLKRIFGGQADSVLIDLRKVIKESTTKEYPLETIINRSKSHPTKNYNFDQEFIEDLFERNYGGDVFFVLSLFYPNLDYFNQSFHVDHLHPQSLFKSHNTPNQEMIQRVGKNWNKIGNLQLLNNELNTSKNDKNLIDWVSESNINKEELFVDTDTSLEFDDFEIFYATRTQIMKEKLITLLQ